MNKPVGGRGKKAPYQTTTKRIPVELEADIDSMIEQYRLRVIDGIEPETDRPLSLDDAIKLSKSLLKAKKSKLDAIHKLVTTIYGIDIDKQDLAD